MKRDLYWDSLKFVLIYLVVYGHIVPHYSEDSRFNMAMFNFIYLFHMPLFIFISGRFSHIRDRQKYKNGILKLLETYIVFQIIRSGIPIILGGEFTIKCLHTPNWILWYLVALIYWRLIVYFIPQSWLSHRNYMLTVSFCISLLAGFIPIGYPFVVQRTLTFLPFFVMGYYSKDFDVRSFVNRVPLYFAVGTMIIAFAILFFELNFRLSFVHHCAFPYWSGDLMHTMMRFVARCIFIPSAIVLSVCLMRLVPTNSTLAKWGSITMFIFIYHSFALNFLFAVVARGYIPQNELLLFAYSIVITAGLIVLARVKFFNILLNPISYLKKAK